MTSSSYFCPLIDLVIVDPTLSKDETDTEKRLLYSWPPGRSIDHQLHVSGFGETLSYVSSQWGHSSARVAGCGKHIFIRTEIAPSVFAQAVVASGATAGEAVATLDSDCKMFPKSAIREWSAAAPSAGALPPQYLEITFTSLFNVLQAISNIEEIRIIDSSTQQTLTALIHALLTRGIPRSFIRPAPAAAPAPAAVTVELAASFTLAAADAARTPGPYSVGAGLLFSLNQTPSTVVQLADEEIALLFTHLLHFYPPARSTRAVCVRPSWLLASAAPTFQVKSRTFIMITKLDLVFVFEVVLRKWSTDSDVDEFAFGAEIISIVDNIFSSYTQNITSTPSKPSDLSVAVETPAARAAAAPAAAPRAPALAAKLLYETELMDDELCGVSTVIDGVFCSVARLPNGVTTCFTGLEGENNQKTHETVNNLMKWTV